MEKIIKKLLHFLPDSICIQMMYFYHFHKFANLKDPKTFNEKLQWLKLHDRNPEYTIMVDKYLVKDYVAKKIGDEYIIPTLGVWNSPEEIDFEALPNQFVLKWNHDSGSIVICKDKNVLNVNEAMCKLQRGKKYSGYWYGREWPYKNVEPKIIAETYMEDDLFPELIDYKFMCFDGKVKVIFTCSGRYSSEGLRVTFYDREWNKLPFIRHYKACSETQKKPSTFDKMVFLAEQLATDIPFVRIDFYEINGKPYFGEITLFPGSGFEPFTPSEWDLKLGDWIKLPDVLKKV